MAILANFTLADASDLREFDKLALGTNNATRGIVEAHLGTVQPGKVVEFQQAYATYQEAIRAKTDHVLRNGISTPQLEAELERSYRAYTDLQRQHRQDPALAFLDDPIHRKKFPVKPYDITGKKAPPHPYLGASAAQDGLWPGYDKKEYFDHFPFLYKYEARSPGKALQAFLREHRMFFHFPETVSRYGVLFVPPPYLSDDVNVELRQHLSKCDKLYHTAPRLSPDTTVAEARLVLSYVEDDMVATVEDDGGTVMGVVGWGDLEKKKDGELVGSFCQKDWHEAPQEDMTAVQAFQYMDKRGWPYMLQVSEHGPRIVTRTTASISHFLPPHTFKDGLGSALYFGISDIREGDRLISRVNAEADGIPAALVETAHADTEYFRTILRHYRDMMKDVFIMAGTTIDPKAALDFLMDCGADGVKLGIAKGTACRTGWTGVALPNAHVGLECGAAIYNKGYGYLDGWGGPDEYIKGIAMSGIQGRQAGGAFMGRREAANPTLTINGREGKFYRGMAGADVQQSVMGMKAGSVDKQMEAAAHLHSEGAEVFVHRRSPRTIGRMLFAHMLLLKSAMSYQGVRAELDDETKVIEASMREAVLHQFHRMAKLYAVHSTAA